MKGIHWFLIILISLPIGYFMKDVKSFFHEPSQIERIIDSTPMKKPASFSIYHTEVHEGKAVKGGLYVQGSVKIPFDIPRDKIKPTILAALKKLKRKHPKSEWFVVYLFPEGEKAEKVGISAGRGEYIDGKITIINGLLSGKEWMESAKRYAAGEMAFQTPLSLEESYFKASIGVSEVFDSYYKETSDSDRSYQLASEEIGQPVKVLKLVREKVLQYYSYGQEQEVLE